MKPTRIPITIPEKPVTPPVFKTTLPPWFVSTLVTRGPLKGEYVLLPAPDTLVTQFETFYGTRIIADIIRAAVREKCIQAWEKCCNNTDDFKPEQANLDAYAKMVEQFSTRGPTLNSLIAEQQKLIETGDPAVFPRLRHLTQLIKNKRRKK